jgi:hypothetical protein
VLLANDQLPATVSVGSNLFYALIGSNSTPASSPAAAVISLPNACTDLTLSATAINLNENGSFDSYAYLYLSLEVNDGSGGIEYVGVGPCQIKAGPKSVGTAVSCTADFGNDIALSGAIAFGLVMNVDAAFSGANILTKVTCTP